MNQAEPTDATNAMFPLVVRLMWYQKVGDKRYLGDRGLIYRPRPEEIRVEAYRKEYDDLVQRISRLLEETPAD